MCVQVNASKKAVSSTSGMETTVHTSDLIKVSHLLSL